MNSGRPVRFRPAGVVWRVLTFCRALGGALSAWWSAPAIVLRGYQPGASSGVRHPPQGGSGLLPPPDPEIDNPINKDGVRSVLPPHNPKYRMEIPG